MIFRVTFSLVIVPVILTAIISFSESQVVPPDLCVCPLNYDPVCASDGETFSNMCQFTCTNTKSEVTILYQGKCLDEVCPCPKIYAPVCASNGRTYANMCLLKCAIKTYYSLSFVKDGPC